MIQRDSEPEGEADSEAEADAPPVLASWKEARHEIAKEPGNHGVFAFGCSVAVVLAVAAFFLVRVLLMR